MDLNVISPTLFTTNYVSIMFWVSSQSGQKQKNPIYAVCFTIKGSRSLIRYNESQFSPMDLHCAPVQVHWSWSVELSIIFIAVVRLTLNVDTQDDYCTHKADPQHTNQRSTQSCFIPSHLGWWSKMAIRLDWFWRPPASGAACECIIVYPFCVCLLSFVLNLSAWVTRMKNRACWIHSVVGNSTKSFFFSSTKHLLNLGCTPLCTALEGLFMFSLPSQVPENDLFQLQKFKFLFFFI